MRQNHRFQKAESLPNTMKKGTMILDMGDHALAGKVEGFIAAQNDALFGKLLDKAAGLLDDEAKLHVDMPEANVSKN